MPLAQHGWLGAWRDGIFPFHHFHSTAHEVLGIAAGTANVIFGGPQGRRFELASGDDYFLGGNALVRSTNPARESNIAEADMPLYASERWGHFSYAIPVADGRYKVTLKFCEGHYGSRNTGVGGLGSRLFDV